MREAPLVRAPRFFAAVCCATAVGIFAIHRSQRVERERLHEGVLRDHARLAARRQKLLAAERADTKPAECARSPPVVAKSLFLCSPQ